MDQTPRGYHFPEGGDPLGDVNLAVQALAEDTDALDGRVVDLEGRVGFSHIEFQYRLAGTGIQRFDFVRPFPTNAIVILQSYHPDAVPFLASSDATGFEIGAKFFSSMPSFNFSYIAVG